MSIEIPRDNLHSSSNKNEESSIPSEFSLLMSLALDDMLSDEEALRFHQCMEQDPALAEEWQQWQAVDIGLHQEPSVEPPSDFLAKFNQRLDEEVLLSDDVSVLMSLALDDLLDADGEERFHQAMESDPVFANQWQIWQTLDERLRTEPSVMPPVDFVHKVNQGLVFELRRRKLWLAAGVGATVATVWIVVAIALFLVGSYLVTNQGAWLGDQIHNLTYATTLARGWITTFGLAMSRSASATLSYPQMWGAALSYFLICGIILAVWTRMLRRSVLQVAS